jgi:hypothetical protein
MAACFAGSFEFLPPNRAQRKYVEKLRENQSVCAFCALDFRLFVVSCSVSSAMRAFAGLV